MDLVHCDVCQTPLHLGIGVEAEGCVRLCLGGLCEGAFCTQCQRAHSHRVAATGSFFPAWRDLFALDDDVIIKGLSLRAEISQKKSIGYVCIDVEEVEVAGMCLQLTNAHISIAKVKLTPVAGSRKLNTVDVAVRHFTAKLKGVSDTFPRVLRGRLGWNGLVGSPCCLDVRNDQLGLSVSKAASAFQALPSLGGVYTLPWLPGKTLHLSIYDGFKVGRTTTSWVKARHALGLEWE